MIRGPIAVGKTSVSQELAKYLDNVAVIPVDWLRHMVSGWNPESKSEVILTAKNALALAGNFLEAGYDVVIDGPFDDLDALGVLTSDLDKVKIQVVTLSASWDEILRRHYGRPENHRSELERVHSVYQKIIENRYVVQGTWIETDNISAAEIASAIARNGLT